MKKLILGISLLSLFATSSYAQYNNDSLLGPKTEIVVEYSSCKELFQKQAQINKNKRMANVGIFAFGVAFWYLNPFGMIIAPAGLVAMTYTEGKRVKFDHMVKLLEQAENFASGSDREPGRLLKRVQRQIKRSLPEVTTMELAQTLVRTSNDGSMCENRPNMGMHKLKKKIKDGSIQVIDLE